MKQIEEITTVRYELSVEECETMLRLGDQALQNVYPKGSTGYAVSVMTKDGNMYQGVSYKSDTRTLTMHAEMTVLAHAAIHGETDIVAITGPNCHMCKQLIYENSLRSGIDIVIVIKEDGGVNQVPISTLMQYPWPDKPKEVL